MSEKEECKVNVVLREEGWKTLEDTWMDMEDTEEELF